MKNSLIAEICEREIKSKRLSKCIGTFVCVSL